MGINYYANIVVGFRFETQDLLSNFERFTVELYHMEESFCTKTGVKLPDIRVIERQSRSIYRINDLDFQDHIDFLEYLSKFLDCTYSMIGELNYINDSFLVFSPNVDMKSYFSGEDFGKVEFGCSYKLEDVINMKPYLDSLKEKIQLLDITVPEPGVFLAYNYG